MLIDASRKIAVKCSECNKYNVATINFFKLSIPTTVICDCGNRVLKAWIKKDDVCLQLNCSLCNHSHLYKFKLKDIMEKNINILSCPDTGVEMGFLGRRNSIDKLITKHNKDMNELMNYFGVSLNDVSDYK